MSARIDRKTALRRAAAPSVDFSLMPDPSAIQALLDAANRTPNRTPDSAGPRSQAASPGPTIVPDKAAIDAEDADAMESVVPDRFRMKTRPRNQPTLQPFDVPMAQALDGDDDVALDAALAFVRTHEQAPKPAPRPSEVPTLILEQRRPSVTLDPQPIDRAPAPRPERPSALTLTPQGEEEVFWNTATAHVEEPTLAEEVDPELDVWMRSRGRRRFMAALGMVGAMLFLVVAAVGGVLVMASPAMGPSAAPAIEAPAPLPPPARP